MITNAALERNTLPIELVAIEFVAIIIVSNEMGRMGGREGESAKRVSVLLKRYHTAYILKSKPVKYKNRLFFEFGSMLIQKFMSEKAAVAISIAWSTDAPFDICALY